MQCYEYDVSPSRNARVGCRRARACLLHAVVAAVGLCAIPRANARETDQFTDRLFQLQQLDDASPVIDAEFNAILVRLVEDLNHGQPRSRRDRDRIIRDAFQASRIDYISQLVTPFESWLRDEAAIELYVVDGGGIYGGAVDYDDMRMGWYIQTAPVLRVGRLVVGIDKIGHFLSQGWFYYQRERELRAAHPELTDDEIDRLIRQYGHELEANYLGFGGTGVYSYADLAANWQGLVFFRALVSGPRPHIAFANGRYVLARRFHIIDYATDAWDEVQNPSRPWSDRFFDKVARAIFAHACAEYRADPRAFLNPSGRSQDPRDYVWEGARETSFQCKRRFAIDDICR